MSRKPSHRIYAVEKPSQQDGQGFWTVIGAAWQHEDGDGMSLRLKLLPAASQDLVIRKIKPKTDNANNQVPDDDIAF